MVVVVLAVVRAAKDSFGCRISYRNSGIMGTETEKTMYTIPEDSRRDAGHRMEGVSVYGVLEEKVNRRKIIRAGQDTCRLRRRIQLHRVPPKYRKHSRKVPAACKITSTMNLSYSHLPHHNDVTQYKDRSITDQDN